MADSLAVLAAELRAAARSAEDTAAAIVRRGAVNLKRDWRANARASAPHYATAYPYSIGFDIVTVEDHVLAEIGPDKDLRQGALGNLLEFGSVHNPPHDDGGRALRAEEPRMVAAFENADWLRL